ncbi:hypothetical protein PCH_Pc13g12660 [Penicillium rubens Wisconsin 54-1255]|uniref:Uncharacterized protein n=1 Tax=Penicillium rubens (strain ATCC 28089 / DSM 1075 / NRRL 1951 / Wisconsin 54-1255) TaxID=500485 RepID=B6H332_PENRW|nr:hypothetical protein PCH_Pc13g12660 [Penicillium rubens Wisconsin 54-1255]
MEVKESNVNLRLATRSRPSQALKQPKLPASASERRAAGSQGAAGRLKLRVERRPLLALEAVMFGVDFTGPYILGVNYLWWNKLKDPGIPAHLSVTRISFETDVKQTDLEEKCLRLRIEEKEKERERL